MGRAKTYSRDEVLDRAMMLFWRRGYEGASLAELVEATGLNRFSLYKEFSGKEGLFSAALARFLGYRLQEYTASLGREPRGLANIRAYFAGLSYEAPYLGCLMFNTLTQKGAVPVAAYRLALSGMREAEALFEANLAAAQRSSEIDPEADPAIAARMLIVIDEGLHAVGIVGSTAAQKDAVVAMALAGLTTKR
jgi:AcrR family transcriptional regulator